MILRIIAFLLMTGPGIVRAETVVVNSGEHEGFSRLVMQFDEATDWALGRDGLAYELRVPGLDDDFDFAGAFQRIPRSRITALSSPGPGRLLIKVAKDVYADAFEIRAGRLVIDIKTGAAPASAEFESALAAPVEIAVATPAPVLADAVAVEPVPEPARPAARAAPVPNMPGAEPILPTVFRSGQREIAAFERMGTELARPTPLVPKTSVRPVVTPAKIEPEPAVEPEVVASGPAGSSELPAAASGPADLAPPPGTAGESFAASQESGMEQMLPAGVAEAMPVAEARQSQITTNNAVAEVTGTDPRFSEPGPARMPAPPPRTSVVPLLPAARSQRVIEAESSLLSALSRAASQGLINADLPSSEQILQQVDALSKPDEEAPVEPQLPETVEETLPHVRVETAFERGNRSQRWLDDLTGDGITCLPGRLFDIENWGRPLTQGAGMAGYRNNVVGEFDTPLPAGVEKLAKYYVYLTFGAEAKATLKQFATYIEDGDLLYAMADIMDDGQAQTPGRLAGQTSCEGPVAMWSVLAMPELNKGDVVNKTEVLREFSALPVHLRRHLGPQLSEKFISVGDVKTATYLRNAILRAPGDSGSGLDYLEAQLDLSNGEDADAAARLDAIVSENGTLAPEALIRLIDTQVDAGLPMSRDTVRSAEALAFEHRDGPLGGELRRVTARGLIYTNQYSKALDLLVQVESDSLINPARVRELRSEVYDNLARNGDDVEFLRRILPDLNKIAFQIESTTSRRVVARRLIDLGFPTEARPFLTGASDNPDREERLLFSEVARLEGKPQVALGYLAGLEGDEIEALRAEIYAGAQDFERAAAIYARLNQAEDQAREAWRSGDWSTVSELGDDSRKAAADLALAPRPDTVETNRELLQSAGQTREVLKQLLQDMPVGQ
ncbi:hypothetical protein [Candidatus Halocynthiibacter alkanivorans]|uniref:hypothetical protein n=1 Tax=Candidatus Halocynthiibacter alkanivorans TaxID=2267619 RepID=UPI000DF28D2F|nr:hypothetical protein [Candidatus Halocynthiibacter alkanivorans]